MSPPDFNSLTKRQLEVARLLAVGKSCREIANSFGLSIKTVDAHRGAILWMLDLPNVVCLARAAIRAGEVHLDEVPGERASRKCWGGR